MKLTSDGTVTGLVQGATINGRTGSRSNGRPGLGRYVYRGTKTLEVELPFECEGGCGRRMEKVGRAVHGGLCAVCRDAAGLAREPSTKGRGPGGVRR